MILNIPKIFFKEISSKMIFFQSLIGKKGIFLMFFSGLLMSIIELSGLALIFPFLQNIAEYSDDIIKIFFFGFGISLIYILRGIVSASLLRIQANLSAKINFKLSDMLINKALKSRYQLFLKQSAAKISGISYSNTSHAALLFQAISSGFNELIILVFILLGVLSLSPTAFFLLLFLSFVLLFIFKPFWRKSSIIGKNTKEIEIERHRYIFDMASSIKDIKIMGLEIPFINKNRKLAEKHSKLFAEYSTISSFQRIFVEVVLVCGIIIFSIFFTLKGIDLNKSSSPAIITIALISLRTAPAFTRLSNSYNGFKYSLPFVDSFLSTYESLNKYTQIREPQKTNFPGDYIAENLSFKYGNNKVLNNCSILIPNGKVVALIGPSGAGKSTLLDLISGLQIPSEGNFKLNGKLFSPFLSKLFPEQIGYVPQAITIFDETLAFNISLEKKPNLKRLEKAIEKSNLSKFVKSLTRGIETVLGEGERGLSGGQKQRIGIARALYREPLFLILDEITSSLDKENAKEIIDQILLLKGRISILFVTHDLTLFKPDMVYKLNKGNIELISQ